MKTTFTRFVCGLLAFSLAVLPAQAGLIGTDQAVSVAQANAARERLQALVARAEVAEQLQSLGVSPQDAQQRVAALTDAEAASLAGNIDRLPAGAFGGQGLGILIVVIFLIWRFFYSDQAKAEAAAKPAAKPAPKPDAKK